MLACRFDLFELPVELHLQLALVADHIGGLLGQRLMLTLRILDRLLDLHLRIGVPSIFELPRPSDSARTSRTVRHACVNSIHRLKSDRGPI